MVPSEANVVSRWGHVNHNVVRWLFNKIMNLTKQQPILINIVIYIPIYQSLFKHTNWVVYDVQLTFYLCL